MAHESDYPKLVAKAWSDPAFEKRLIADPVRVLKEEGWDIHPSMSVEVRADTDRQSLVIGIPKKPEGLNDEQLRAEAAGSCCGNPCC